MLRTQWLRAGVALVAFALMSRGSVAQVKLEPKFPEGQKLTSSTDTRTAQVLTLAGMNIETKAEQNAVSSASYGKRGPDGGFRVDHKIESMQVRINAAGMEANFDSVNPDKDGDNPLAKQLAEIYRAMSKSGWTSVHDKSGRAVGIEGNEKALEGLNAETAAHVRSQLDADYLKETINKAFERLPTRPIQKGESWEHSEAARIGGGQTLTFKHRYTYTGTVERDGKMLDRIDAVVTEVQYEIGADSPLPLKLVKSDLKIASSKGEMLFDRQLGYTVEETDKTQIKGSITFLINGQEFPGELDLTFEITSRIRP